jgi:hypothetical protein
MLWPYSVGEVSHWCCGRIVSARSHRVRPCRGLVVKLLGTRLLYKWLLCLSSEHIHVALIIANSFNTSIYVLMLVFSISLIYCINISIYAHTYMVSVTVKSAGWFGGDGISSIVPRFSIKELPPSCNLLTIRNALMWNTSVYHRLCSKFELLVWELHVNRHTCVAFMVRFERRQFLWNSQEGMQIQMPQPLEWSELEG